jgi:hypothetical protein
MLFSRFFPAAAVLALASAGALAAPPVISNVAAAPQGGTRTNFSATVNPGGSDATVTFRYGTTAAYGSVTTARTVVELGLGAQNVSVQAGDLVHGQTYHFQAVATNADGTATSLDQTFLQNVAPVARADSEHIFANRKPRTFVVLDNDSDADGEALKIIAVTQGAHGATTIENETRITYTPGATFTNNDKFTYTVRDTLGATHTATVSIVNNAPRPQADRVTLPGHRTVEIPVLSNDHDPDRDPLAILSAAHGSRGTTAISGNAILYTPNSNFGGFDTFTYTVSDGLGGTASATVTIGQLPGTHGSVVMDRKGQPVGYLRLDALTSGAFTGKIQIERKYYTLMGSFGPDGRFQGEARDEDGDALAVDIRIIQEGETATLFAELGNGLYEAAQSARTLTAAGLTDRAGRYTLELPALGGSTDSDRISATVPTGHGWASIKIDEDGSARIRGKTGDGRGFSASAVLGGGDDAPVLPIYASPDDGLLSGTLSFGDTISGELAWERDASDATFYPDGFQVKVNASGARYVPPEKGKHALTSSAGGGRNGTITISEGRTPGFTRELRFSKRDNVEVLEEGLDRLEIEVDRKSGMFKGKFRLLDDLGRRTKFSGVLLQNEGRGSGVFRGNHKSGRVELSISAGASTPDNGAGDASQ